MTRYGPVDEGGRSSSQFGLGEVLAMIGVLGLVLSIMSRAARSGSAEDWRIVGMIFGILAAMATPAVIMGLLIRRSATANPLDRDVVWPVVQTLLVLMLLGMSILVNSY